MDVTALRLSLSDRGRGCGHGPPLSVTARLDVAPLTIIAALQDFYSIFVYSSEGVVAYSAEGNLARGDFTVQLIEE